MFTSDLHQSISDVSSFDGLGVEPGVCLQDVAKARWVIEKTDPDCAVERFNHGLIR